MFHLKNVIGLILYHCFGCNNLNVDVCVCVYVCLGLNVYLCEENEFVTNTHIGHTIHATYLHTNFNVEKDNILGMRNNKVALRYISKRENKQKFHENAKHNMGTNIETGNECEKHTSFVLQIVLKQSNRLKCIVGSFGCSQNLNVPCVEFQQTSANVCKYSAEHGILKHFKTPSTTRKHYHSIHYFLLFLFLFLLLFRVCIVCIWYIIFMRALVNLHVFHCLKLLFSSFIFVVSKPFRKGIYIYTRHTPQLLTSVRIWIDEKAHLLNTLYIDAPLLQV